MELGIAPLLDLIHNVCSADPPPPTLFCHMQGGEGLGMEWAHNL